MCVCICLYVCADVCIYVHMNMFACTSDCKCMSVFVFLCGYFWLSE